MPQKHIEINDQQVTINGTTTFTMTPGATTTVEGVTLRCDDYGVVNVVNCEGGSYSLHQRMNHLPRGATVIGYTHRQAPRPPSGTPIPKQRPASGTPLPKPGPAAPPPDLAEFPKITALPPQQLLYMIETVSAAQVMLTDNRATEAVNLVNKMADRLGIRDEINAAVLKFLLDGGEMK